MIFEERGECVVLGLGISGVVIGEPEVPELLGVRGEIAE